MKKIFLNKKGQGALEYLLLIGGAVLVAAVVLSLITGIAQTGESAATARATEAICAPLNEARCGVDDPDGEGDLLPAACTWDATNKRCVAA